MAEVAYNVGKSKVAANVIPNGATVLKAAIIITSKTGAADPDLATMAAIDAVGTVALHSNRQPLASVTKTTDNTNDRINWSAATFSFPAAAGVTALALVIYDATTDTDDTTRIPIAFYDTNFGAGIAMDGGLNVTIPADFLRLA
jgi:hypothetical protein